MKSLFSQWILTDAIEINSSPTEIWDFFVNLEENYIDWHPTDHKKFKWTGEPMASGSKWYAEEMEWKLEATKRHTKEEGEYLKYILESKSQHSSYH